MFRHPVFAYDFGANPYVAPSYRGEAVMIDIDGSALRTLHHLIGDSAIKPN